MRLDAETTELLALVAKAAAEKALDMVQVPTWRPATVIWTEGRIAMVDVDGDELVGEDEDVQVPASVLTPTVPAPGTRVMVRFAPPHGVFVDGWITAP